MTADEIQRIFDLFILKTLAQEPMRCSELEQRIEKKTRGVFGNSISFAKALERLESAGYVHPGSGKIYSVTAAGQEHLTALQTERSAELKKFLEEGTWPAYPTNKAQPVAQIRPEGLRLRLSHHGSRRHFASRRCASNKLSGVILIPSES